MVRKLKKKISRENKKDIFAIFLDVAVGESILFIAFILLRLTCYITFYKKQQKIVQSRSERLTERSDDDNPVG